jgi:fructose-1,6-bisphosphatase/inositol monophosphatase family enzyme
LEGKPGYATSIALVSQSGQPILGVVYDPVRGDLFEAVTGRGVTLNGSPLETMAHTESQRTTWFADRSLRNHPGFARLQTEFDIRFEGGAVMNSLQLLTEPNSVYVKAPKKDLGGCAIWDLAAVSLMLAEHSGQTRLYDGSPLHLNRPDSVFFNDVGFAFACADIDVDALLVRIKAIASQGSAPSVNGREAGDD